MRVVWNQYARAKHEPVGAASTSLIHWAFVVLCRVFNCGSDADDFWLGVRVSSEAGGKMVVDWHLFDLDVVINAVLFCNFFLRIPLSLLKHCQS
jgi:hypothetical protein